MIWTLIGNWIQTYIIYRTNYEGIDNPNIIINPVIIIKAFRSVELMENKRMWRESSNKNGIS